MGGGKNPAGVSPSVSTAETNTANTLSSIATQQNDRAGQLFGSAFPGFQQAEDFYSTLATGDPYAIARATAPATQQITKAADSAKANILANLPPGGEKNLALEQVEANRGAQVSDVATKSFLNAPNALAQLAGQGVNESISSAGTGISGLSAASNTLGQIGNQQLQAQEFNAQFNAEQKGSTFGSLAGLGGDVASAAGDAGSFAALFAL